MLPLVLEMARVAPPEMEVAEPAAPMVTAPAAVVICELAETVRVSSDIPALNRALMLPARVVGPPERARPPWKASVSAVESPSVNLPALARVLAPVTARLPVRARSKLLPEVFSEPAESRPWNDWLPDPPSSVALVTVTACKVAVVPVVRLRVPIWLMAAVAVKLPEVLTVRLLAVPDAAPVTVATEMTSVPPSPRVSVTPALSNKVPGLESAAEAPEDPTFRDWVAVTTCPSAPSVTAAPALMGPERSTPPAPVI